MGKVVEVRSPVTAGTISPDVFGKVFGMSKSLPPRKTSFAELREREFLYLREIDAVIAAVAQSRASCRNTALALLLFCQGLQPAELFDLTWNDVDFAENIIRVKRTFYSCPNAKPLCLTARCVTSSNKQAR